MSTAWTHSRRQLTPQRVQTPDWPGLMEDGEELHGVAQGYAGGSGRAGVRLMLGLSAGTTRLPFLFTTFKALIFWCQGAVKALHLGVHVF